MNAVDHPNHYNRHPSGIECIDIVRHMSFNIGNAVKYLWRAGLKEDNSVVQDLRKANWYIADEIARIARQMQRDGVNLDEEEETVLTAESDKRK